MDLKAKQTSALSAMLTNGGDEKQEIQWKVLIYDKFCEQIIAPLLNLGELRSLGVTLNLLITTNREPVPDLPAVYFVQPTPENIALIGDDLANKLYSSSRLHFSTSLPRELLEQLAKRALETDSVAAIGKVFDEYKQFTMIQESFVSLHMKNSYKRLNDPKQKDTDLMAFIDEIVSSLFCVVVTLGRVPVIRCRRGEAAEMVARKLYERLREHLKSRNNLFDASSRSASFHRPLLILVDRNVDLAVPVSHCWTYQALVHDLLNIRNTQVSVPVRENGQTRLVKYELQETDVFWKQNAGQIFPRVAEAIQTALTKYQEELKKIDDKRRNPTMSTQNLDVNDVSDLAETINALPLLQKQKRILDMHTLVATAVSDQLKERELDAYFAIETDILSKGIFLELDALVTQLSPDALGSPRDKLRLFMIHFLCNTTMSDDDFERCQTALRESYSSSPQTEQADQDLKSLAFLKTHKFVNRIASTSPAADVKMNSTDSESYGVFGKLASKVYTQSSGLISGVRNLLPGKTDLPITTIADALLNDKDTSENKDYLYLDPLTTSSSRQENNTHLDAMVVVLGGGNYTEFQNLQDFVAKQPTTQARKSITYVTTELLNPEEFLQQCTQMS